MAYGIVKAAKSKVSFGGVNETKKKKEIMNQEVSQKERRYP